MTRGFEELDQAFDTQEAQCVKAAEQLEAARTRIGKFFARRRLERNRQELEQITDEHDIVTLYGLGREPAGEAEPTEQA